MLRLVCCDVDGTLLPKGAEAVPADTVEVLRRLTDRGVTVVIASGRPYTQLRALFSPLAHRLIFVCLDGAVTIHRECVLHKRPLPRRQALDFLARHPEAVVHGRERVYIPGGDAAAIGESFLQLELPGGFAERADWFRVSYRDAAVTELVAPCAHKGNAVRTVMEKYGIPPEQAAAFGDGENDLPMLEAVGHPYLMRKAGVSPAGIPRTADVAATLRELFGIS